MGYSIILEELSELGGGEDAFSITCEDCGPTVQVPPVAEGVAEAEGGGGGEEVEEDRIT